MVQQPGTTDEVGRFLLIVIVILLVLGCLWLLYSRSEAERTPAPQEQDLRAAPD